MPRPIKLPAGRVPRWTASNVEEGAIVTLARKLYDEHYADERPGSEQGSCLYWAAAAMEAAHRHGLRLVLQAGSASFRRLPPHLDDGRPETATHFSYVYSGLGRAEVCLAMGALPEMHVWVGDPVTQTLIDLTTGFLPLQCERVGGLEWLEVTPPAYLWTRASSLPDGWHYEPSLEASLFAERLLIKILKAG